MSTEICIVYPKDAALMLETNKTNRPVRKSWVDWLAKTITDGEFITTHQGLAFDVTGRLIDGQHRLLACIKADKPIKVQVTRGLPVEAWFALDQGVLRTNSDILEIPRPLSEILGRAHKFAVHGKSKPVNLVALKNSELARSAEEVLSSHFTNKKVFGCSTVRLGIAISLTCGIDRSYIFEQYKALYTDDFDTMTPIARLFYKQAVNGQILSTELNYTLAKTMITLDPRNNTISRFVASTIDDKLSKARSLIENIIYDN
jgi:hypothetical protein